MSTENYESDNSFQNVWRQILKQLESLLPSASFKTWISPLEEVSLDGGILTVCCQDEFMKYWIESRYMSHIFTVAQSFFGHSVEEVIVRVGGKGVQRQEATNEPFKEILAELKDQTASFKEISTDLQDIGNSLKDIKNSVQDISKAVS